MSVTAEKIKHAYIVNKKGIRKGSPVIVGTGIKVMDIAIRYHILGNTPDEINLSYPDLTLAQIYDAISYYYENKGELDREWKESLMKVERLRKGHKSILGNKLEQIKNIH